MESFTLEKCLAICDLYPIKLFAAGLNYDDVVLFRRTMDYENPRIVIINNHDVNGEEMDVDNEVLSTHYPDFLGLLV